MHNEVFHTGPFCPVAARAFRSALRAGLFVLAGWLLYVIGERRIPRPLRLEVRALLRAARDSLTQVLIETFAHGLAPPAPRRRIHDHRPRYRGRRATPARRSAISLRRLLKRALPKAGVTLRAQFAALFLILRHFPRMLARLRRHIFARAKGAWSVAGVATLIAVGATHAPPVRDTS